jgi:hypothetical protein
VWWLHVGTHAAGWFFSAVLRPPNTPTSLACSPPPTPPLYPRCVCVKPTTPRFHSTPHSTSHPAKPRRAHTVCPPAALPSLDPRAPHQLTLPVVQHRPSFPSVPTPCHTRRSFLRSYGHQENVLICLDFCAKTLGASLHGLCTASTLHLAPPRAVYGVHVALPKATNKFRARAGQHTPCFVSCAVCPAAPLLSYTHTHTLPHYITTNVPLLKNTNPPPLPTRSSRPHSLRLRPPPPPLPPKVWSVVESTTLSTSWRALK